MTENRSSHSREDPDPTDAPSAAVGADGPPENEPVTEAKYEYHECAGIFPMMDEASLAELTARIKESGLREPIVLHEGRILDGRNRYLACLAAEVEPRFETLPEGVDPLEYVFDLNFTRRHLSNTQREAAAVEYANMKQGRNPKTTNGPFGPFTPHSQAEAADKFKVSHRNVKRAAAVKKADPERFEDMKADKITTGGATRQIKDKQSSSSKPQKLEGQRKPSSPPLPLSLAGFTTGFKRALAVFENAKLPVQKEIVKKLATDFNAVILFAGEEFHPQRVTMFGNSAPANPVMQVNKPKFEPAAPAAPAEAPPAAPEPVIDANTANAASELDAPNEPTIAEPMYFPGLLAVMDKCWSIIEDAEDRCVDVTDSSSTPFPWKAKDIAASTTPEQTPFLWRAEGIAASTPEQRLDFVREVDPELAGQVEKGKTKLEDAEAIVLELMAAMRSVLDYKLTSEEEQALVRYQSRFPDGVAEAKKAVEECDAAREAASRARAAKLKKLSAKLLKGADTTAIEELAHKIAEEVEDTGIDLEDREAVRDEGGIDAIFENAITNEINAEFDAMAKGLITPEALNVAAAEDYTEGQFTYCVIADLVTKAVKLAKIELRG